MTTIAVRTVSETDDVHVIEGLAFPFKGRDTYGTFFSARTDYHWDMFPDIDPTSATRSGEPKFIRPATFHHGFDPDFGLSRIGGWSPVRMDDDGVWVQAQLDKRQTYYATRLAPLLEKNALGLSGGSAEHSVRIDQKSGEILDWPAYELALTPVESNPLAVIAARAGETVTILSAERRDISAEERKAMPDDDFAGPDRSFPIAEPEDVAAAAHSLGRASGDQDAIKAKIIAIAKRKGADFVAQLPDAWKEAPARAGIRAGARNSASDLALIQQIHDLSTELGASCEDAEPDADDMAGRSDDLLADAQPATVTIAVRDDAPTFEDIQARLAARATEAGAQVARRLIG